MYVCIYSCIIYIIYIKEEIMIVTGLRWRNIEINSMAFSFVWRERRAGVCMCV